MTMWQAKMAEAVYAFQADVDRRPPASFEDMVAVGRHEFQVKTLSFLLRRQTDSEVEETRTIAEAKAVQNIIETMTANNIEKLDEVVADFFTRSGRYMLWLLVRQKYEFRMTLDASTYNAEQKAEQQAPREPETF
jgi:hypothetical protein